MLKPTGAKSVDEYIEQIEEPRRSDIRALHALIANAVPKLTPSIQMGMVGYGTYKSVLDTLEQAVKGKSCIAGDRFSAADVYVGAHVGWGLQFGSIEKRPAFAEYHKRVSDRPAAQRATELDNAAMPAKSA